MTWFAHGHCIVTQLQSLLTFPVSQYIESDEDVDDQLILRIPFSGSVKLRSLLLKTGPASHTPTKIRLVGSLRFLFSLLNLSTTYS